jgi:hypothetical protein
MNAKKRCDKGRGTYNLYFMKGDREKPACLWICSLQIFLTVGDSVSFDKRNGKKVRDNREENTEEWYTKTDAK